MKYKLNLSRESRHVVPAVGDLWTYDSGNNAAVVFLRISDEYGRKILPHLGNANECFFSIVLDSNDVVWSPVSKTGRVILKHRDETLVPA